MSQTNKTKEYMENETLVTEMITKKNLEEQNKKELNRMTYGEPEEGYKPEKQMTGDEFILSGLNEAIAQLRKGAASTIKYITHEMDETGIEFHDDDLEWSWFVNHDLDAIFENYHDEYHIKSHDAEWYLYYVINLCKIIRTKPELLKSTRAVYKGGKLVYKQTSIKQYMIDTLQLVESNPIHSKFIDVINKVADYFDE